MIAKFLTVLCIWILVGWVSIFIKAVFEVTKILIEYEFRNISFRDDEAAKDSAVNILRNLGLIGHGCANGTLLLTFLVTIGWPIFLAIVNGTIQRIETKIQDELSKTEEGS